MGYLYLFIAIIAEVVATSSLKLSDGFTNLLPSLVVVIGYGISFFFLSLVLKTMSIGIAYAIWAGGGIIAIAVIGVISFKQIPDAAAIAGLVLITSGVLVINLFSNSVTH